MKRDGTNAGRFISLGETMMDCVPPKGEYIFINGENYYILDRAWSIKVTAEDQPNFASPQVMLTLLPDGPSFSDIGPREDFYM
jgi:hypothetical protein